jgi:hypothetical protein
MHNKTPRFRITPPCSILGLTGICNPGFVVLKAALQARQVPSSLLTFLVSHMSVAPEFNLIFLLAKVIRHLRNPLSFRSPAQGKGCKSIQDARKFWNSHRLHQLPTFMGRKGTPSIESVQFV